MIVFDEFASTALLENRHRLNTARFPNFGKLAAASTWYPNATTVADFTPVAVPSILTGKRVKSGTIPIASELPDNLFTFLGPGHSMNVEEPVTALCPESLCARTRASTLDRWHSLFSDLAVVVEHRVAPRDLEARLPAVDQSFQGFHKTTGDNVKSGDDAKTATVRNAATGDVPFATLQNRRATSTRFVQGMRAKGRPPFNFLHIALPHIPWEFLPSGQEYPVTGAEAPGLSGDDWTGKPDVVAQAEQRYLLQVQYADRVLGQIMDRLRSQGRWDQALVVVTADHGVSFKPGTHRRIVSPENLGEIAPVPLFIKSPKQVDGRVDSSWIRTVDILPTMARVLGLKLPWKPDGPNADVEVSGVSASHRVFAARQQEAIDREHRLFGSGRDSLFGVGLPNVVARSASSKTSAEIDGSYENVNPTGTLVPAFVTGRLSDHAFDRVAIVVNGHTAAVGPTYDAGGVRFSALISPDVLRTGRNDVVVAGVRSGRLVPLNQKTGQSYRLTGNGIETSNHAKVRIAPGAAQGYVDTLGVENGRLRIEGWALRNGRPVQRIIVFADGAFVASTAPAVSRPDVAKEHGKRALESGFLVAAQVHGSPRRVRAFALSGDTATELTSVPSN